jgi:hypothetical protein
VRHLVPDRILHQLGEVQDAGLPIQGQSYSSSQSQDSPGALDSPPHRSPLFERALPQ